MKKIVLGILGVVLLVIIIIFSFKKWVFVPTDVILQSVDGKVEFGFESITNEKTWSNGDFEISFHLMPEINFYEKYVKNNEFYVEDIQQEGYLFCKEGHYFYVEYLERTLTISELVGGFYANGTEYYVKLPYSSGLAWAETNFLPYDELVGIDTYTDLLEFYKRTNGNEYVIDEINNTVYLSMYSFGEMLDKGVKIVATDEGIEVTLLEEYK